MTACGVAAAQQPPNPWLRAPTQALATLEFADLQNPSVALELRGGEAARLPCYCVAVPSDAVADPFELERFVNAQERVYDQVHRELRQGKKTSHWMWFVFPQLAGLGRSAMAARYAIGSLGEAQAYLEHDVLGARLRECTRLVLDASGRSLHDIFGSPDDLKFRSCMTLFARANPSATVFEQALAKYCAGEPDPRTLSLLSARGLVP